MSLDHHHEDFLDKLLKGKLYIAFCVHKGKFYWVVDWEEHFNLDQLKNIDAFYKDEEIIQYLPKNVSLTKHRENTIESFRGGIVKLKEDNFHDYLSLSDTKVFSSDELASLLFSNEWGKFSELQNKMEQIMSFGSPNLSEKDWKMQWRLRTLLPTFYINFDRKLFIHMRSERFYHEVVHEGWRGYMEDFEHMIPVSQRYWSRNLNEDYWLVTKFSN